MSDKTSNANGRTLSHSGLEKKGGYPSPKTPVAKLPKVPTGPAPGAKAPGQPKK